ASIFRRAWAGRAWTGALTILLWTRLRRAAARFTALAAQNQPPPANPRRARIRKPRPAPPRLPRGFAWLLAPVPEAAASASQLRHLLAEPEMQGLIAADPRFGRILRPLCHMVGIRPPPFLRLARTGPAPAPETMQPGHGAPPPASTGVSHPPVQSAPDAFTSFAYRNEQRAPPP
ncbi:MAG TPA: hypothetical protein VFN77_02350, partial [Acetobacteraceae bacterium]|nr:hypothetical protein [Acetobacteraceae bacterium]